MTRIITFDGFLRNSRSVLVTKFYAEFYYVMLIRTADLQRCEVLVLRNSCYVIVLSYCNLTAFDQSCRIIEKTMPMRTLSGDWVGIGVI